MRVTEVDDALVVVRQLQFTLRNEHAVRDHTTHRSLVERDAGARNVAPERREHANHAGARVRRPTHNLDHAVTGVDLHDPQLVGVWMLLGLDNTRDDERAQRLRRIFDAFDLKADDRQPVDDLLERRCRVEMVAEPVERKFHVRVSQRGIAARAWMPGGQRRHSWNDFSGISTARAGGGTIPEPPDLPYDYRRGQPRAA